MLFQIRTFLFISILTIFTTCNGQNRVSSKPSIGDTVSALGKSVMVIYQDKKNNFWFGSNGQGVYQYDGKKIIHFTKKDGLCADEIWGIQEDKAGNIYFDTQEGVSKFDGKTISTLTETIAIDNQWKLDSNDLWFKGKWNENGPCRYDGKYLYHLKFSKPNLDEEIFKNTENTAWSPYGIYTMYKDKRGNIWFGTSNLGLCRFDGKAVDWLYEKQLTDTPEGGSFGIRSIFEDKSGKFWFCNTRYRYNISPNESKNGLINYKKESGIDNLKTARGTDLVYFMSICEDNNGDLWMLTYNQGVFRYDGKNVTHYPINDGSKEITLFSIYKDRQGNLWLGTHDDGAYKFNGKSFEKFNF
jgi:ligand-binding sensor domain-containing protein